LFSTAVRPVLESSCHSLPGQCFLNISGIYDLLFFMADHLYEFNPWNRRKALTYHKSFHFSVALQINHLIFLHSYLFGIALISSAGGWPAVLVIAAGYIVYTFIIIRPSAGAMLYSLLLAGLFMSSKFMSSLLLSYDSFSLWKVVLLGVGIVLISFICQLIGHSIHEEHFAPPSLMHGFVAAPVLEFQWLLFSTTHCDNDMYIDIIGEVVENRKLLAANKARRDQQQIRRGYESSLLFGGQQQQQESASR
jgi:hypothetical protein